MGMPTPAQVGWVDVSETVDFDGDRMTVLRQLVAWDPSFEKSGKRGDGKGDKTPTATIVLRGSTAHDLDDLESDIDDGLNVIRSLLQDGRLVPGAGATELELARRVDVYGDKMKGQQRHVIKRFAMALEVIPRTLAENAAVGGRGTRLLLIRLKRKAKSPTATEKQNHPLMARSSPTPTPCPTPFSIR